MPDSLGLLGNVASPFVISAGSALRQVKHLIAAVDEEIIAWLEQRERRSRTSRVIFAK